MNNGLINRIQIKQVQRVGPSLISGHCQFIESCLVNPACQFYRINRVCFLCPAML